MSTTTVSVRSTTQDASLAEARRQEAAAREAARQAAIRAARLEHERQLEEARRAAIRHRLDLANRAIAEHEARYAELVARLDAATTRLPDLCLHAPGLPSLRADAAGDPTQVESHADHLADRLSTFSHTLEQAIQHAEHLFQQRIAKAAAWRTATELEQQCQFKEQAAQSMAAQLGTEHRRANPTDRPAADCDLIMIENYVTALRERLASVDAMHSTLAARLDARRRAQELKGAAIDATRAADAFAHHDAQRGRHARLMLQQAIDRTLTERSIAIGELSDATQTLVRDALAHAHILDRTDQVVRWILKDHQRTQGLRRALALMQSAPDLVNEHPRLRARWEAFVKQLQSIASGANEFMPTHEREYLQICNDARRLVSNAITRADWVKAMAEQGFEVLERDDESGLVIVDLDNPQVWLEASELECEDGGFATVLEVKTDATTLSASESAITETICSKIANASATNQQSIASTSEVLETKPRITRARRPAPARRAFQQSV